MAAAKEDLHLPLIFTIGALFVILLFVMILLLQAYFYQAARQEYQAKVVAPRNEALAADLTAQQEELNRYRWIDQEQGIVGIPVERAVELIIQDGLSAERPATQPRAEVQAVPATTPLLPKMAPEPAQPPMPAPAED